MSKNKTPLLKDSGALAPRDSLQKYLDEVRSYDLLSREEELRLAKAYFDHQDQEAAQKLVTSNLRFVVKVAMEYSKFGAHLIDLIQEGNMGLLHAVKEFNPYKEVKLITYAVWWIRGYIQEYLMRQESLVRMGTTKAQKKLYYKLNKEKQKLLQEGLEPSVKLLSSRLGVTEKDVKLMSERLSAKDISLDQPLTSDSDQSLLNVLENSSEEHSLESNLEFKENVELLHEVLRNLASSFTQREKVLLKERILSDTPKKLSELGREWGISREAARQSEERLLKKIRQAFPGEVRDIN